MPVLLRNDHRGDVAPVRAPSTRCDLSSPHAVPPEWSNGTPLMRRAATRAPRTSYLPSHGSWRAVIPRTLFIASSRFPGKA
jgi:hypothetical protein